MVVIKGFGGQPMMLLTSLHIDSGQKDLWFIISAYLKRWSIEETIYVKHIVMQSCSKSSIVYQYVTR
jgi:hypothetical protein